MKRRTLLWIALGVTLLLANLAIAFTQYLFKSYVIRSEAMEPAIRRGDRVFVLRTKNIPRGDLVVFYREVAQVKRAVAVGGDTILIRDKRVNVNGADLTEPYVRYEPDSHLKRPAIGPLRVPAGHFFVLGDNRDRTNDSRYYGTVERKDVIGRVAFVFSPTRGFRR